MFLYLKNKFMAFPHKTHFSVPRWGNYRVSAWNSINCHTCLLEQRLKHADFDRFQGFIKRLTLYQQRLLSIGNTSVIFRQPSSDFKVIETDESGVDNYHNCIGSIIVMYRRTSVTNDNQFKILQGEVSVHSISQG